MRLKRDIYSTFNPKDKYANAGDEVQPIAPIIVRGKDGQTFSITPDDILESGQKIIVEERTTNKIPAKKQSKTISNNNQTLF